MSAAEATPNGLMAIDTEMSVEAELARLEELENQLTHMKVRCDSDSIQSSSGSTVSTLSGGSAASSPLNESGSNTCSMSTPSTPVQKGRANHEEQDEEEKSTVPRLAAPDASPSAVAAAQRFGVAKPVVGVRRVMSSTELPSHRRTGSAGRIADTSSPADSASKAKKLSSTETRRAYALSVKARIAGNANVDGGFSVRKPLVRQRSNGSSHGSETGSSSGAATSMLPPPTSLELITPSILMTPHRRRDSMGSNTSSVSSIASSPSTTSSVSNASVSARASSRLTASTAASRLNRVKSASAVTGPPPSAMSAPSSRSPGKLSTGVPPPKVAVMQKLLQASNGDAKDARVDSDLVRQLKQQYVLAEQGVQQLLKPASGTMPPSPMRGAETEVRRLKGGMKTLNEHSVALMLACEVLQRQQDSQQDEIAQMRLVNDQLMREMEVLAAASSTSSKFSTPVSPDEDAPRADAIDGDVGEDSGRDDTIETRRFSAADSSLSAFVNEMLRKATEKIEEKWKARFAEKLAEHEWALAVERERASASVMSNSRLVAETKHEKDDELKALREENVAVKLENKQLAIEMAALHTDLDYWRSQLSQQDELRNSSSFWEKTTDLAKQNRALTEELTMAQQSVKKLDEVIKDLRMQNHDYRAENEVCVKRTQELEMENQLLRDQHAQVETKFDDEKTRREQFQVNVEQLTVENTALYAQMVALQATHEAKMEEMRATFDKRNVILAGEMRALEAQNKLMRRMDSTGPAEASSLASSSSALSAEAERELDARLQHVTDELLSVRQELVVRTDQITDLEQKVADGEITRRKLHNTIQELRGNIRVHVRLRPFLRSDGEEARAENPRSAIRSDTFGGTISTNVDKPHTFAFDKVYGQSESQEAVFSDVADFIQSAMDGYNVCIFAYGQTGSGKTHTMQGSGKAQMRGIIPRALQLIINSCRELSTQGWQYTLHVTFFEIYNETIRDLLSNASGGGDDRKYNIRTDRRGKNYVEGLVTVPIDFDVAENQLEEIVNLAACNRSVDKTDMNAHSSRSHSIFGLTIRGVNEVQNTEVEGSLSLVDLAGSERLSRSNATGDRLKEAQAINKSLSAMADVFQALAKKSAHVPYRNSKLTYVLQPALSGDGKTLMLVNLSPTFQSVDESVCSLRFAQNVSQCELGAPTRQIKAREPSAAAISAAVRSSPARALTSSSSAGAPSSATGTPTGTARPRSLTAAATPPIAKKLQF